MAFSSLANSTRLGAAIGPKNGYSTPTNVFAQTGEATSEQHSASTIERFFTCAIPQRWQGRNYRLVVQVSRSGPKPLAIIAPLTRRGEHSRLQNVAHLRRYWAG